jgi:uncharacterized membrane protein
MNKGRLEAFSDGVMAIILTIMVLELKVPHEPTLAALRPLAPVFLSYLISFIVIGIYWNSHHHLFQIVHRVNGRIMWANLNLLFWMSLIPFVTGWTGETNFVSLPVALHGCVFLLVGISYCILSESLITHHGQDSKLAIVIGDNLKGRISLVIYAVGIALAFVNSWLAFALYALVSAIWLVPDRRIEKILKS